MIPAAGVEVPPVPSLHGAGGSGSDPPTPSPTETIVLGLMLTLIAAGIALFLAAPFIGRLVVGEEGDPVAVTRVVQVVAVLLMVVALVFRPHRDDTAAFPPPPDLMEEPTP